MTCDHEAGGVLDWQLGKNDEGEYRLQISYACKACGVPFAFVREVDGEAACPLVGEAPDHLTVRLALKPLETVH